MSRAKAAEQREENLNRLKALAEAANAPGKDQAKQALDVIEREQPSTKDPALAVISPPPVVETPTTGPESASKGEPRKQVQQLKTELPSINTKAEKISISLHPQDQERLSKIENALRSKGLVGRSVSTSFLLKIALASFDEAKVRDLKSIAESIQAQDQRGKWMK
jgi:hypothetical protein